MGQNNVKASGPTNRLHNTKLKLAKTHGGQTVLALLRELSRIAD